MADDRLMVSKRYKELLNLKIKVVRCYKALSGLV